MIQGTSMTMRHALKSPTTISLITLRKIGSRNKDVGRPTLPLARNRVTFRNVSFCLHSSGESGSRETGSHWGNQCNPCQGQQPSSTETTENQPLGTQGRGPPREYYFFSNPSFSRTNRNNPSGSQVSGTDTISIASNQTGNQRQPSKQQSSRLVAAPRSQPPEAAPPGSSESTEGNSRAANGRASKRTATRPHVSGTASASALFPFPGSTSQPSNNQSNRPVAVTAPHLPQAAPPGSSASSEGPSQAANGRASYCTTAGTRVSGPASANAAPSQPGNTRVTGGNARSRATGARLPQSPRKAPPASPSASEGIARAPPVFELHPRGINRITARRSRLTGTAAEPRRDPG
eukprot:16452381-Heterocapsa_arctica.AAC.1